MPDLPNRAEFERQLTRELTRAFNSAKREMTRWLGRRGMTTSDLATMPPDVLAELEANMTRIFSTTLDDVFVSAAQNFAGIMGFAIDDDLLRDRANQWASTYAPTLAKSMTRNIRIRLSGIAQRSPGVPMDNALIAGIIASVLSLSKVVQTAVTETTNAISQGEQVVQDDIRRQQAQVESIWYSQLDERTCPVCGARHGKRMGEGWTIPPPAHPNCRCYIGYRITQGNQVTVVFDDEVIARRLRQGRV